MESLDGTGERSPNGNRPGARVWDYQLGRWPASYGAARVQSSGPAAWSYPGTGDSGRAGDRGPGKAEKGPARECEAAESGWEGQARSGRNTAGKDADRGRQGRDGGAGEGAEGGGDPGRGGRAEGAGAEGRKPTASAENPLDERKAEGGPGAAAAWKWKPAAQSAGRISGKRFELGARNFGAAPGRDRGRAGLPGSALAGAVPAPGRKGAWAATCARGAAAGKRAGMGPHLGRYGAVKEACPGALQEPPGQAIITVKIGN